MKDPSLKEIIKNEYIKCVHDPTHFIKKYCYIQHPKRGRLLFNLYPFQDKVIKLWHKHDYIIINKSRQLGITTLAAAEALHMMLFNSDKNVLCIATKQETAKNLISKVQFMYTNLPSWLKVEAIENNKLSLKLENGSQIKAATAASDSARSESVSLLILDEAAFIEGIEEIWASAQQTLAMGGKAIVISTPYGTGNWFHRTYSDSETSTNSKFLPIKLPWYVHPERDESWRKHQEELLGDPKIAAQELDADFSTSGDTVFLNDWVKWIEENTIEEPLEKRGVHKDFWIWEPPDYSEEYLIVSDVARGDGKDFSAAQIIKISTNTQVAEFRSHLSPREFGHFLVAIATEYNNGLLVIENNNMGWATVEIVLELGYSNLYHSPKGNPSEANSYLKQYENPENSTPGFNTSLMLRPLIINKFREYVGDKQITIKSKRLLEEMKVFIWKNGRPQAQYGYNDDLIMCMSISQYLRDTSFKFQQHNLDMTRKVLDNIRSNKTEQLGAYTRNSYVSNPYAFTNYKGENEDLKWLL